MSVDAPKTKSLPRIRSRDVTPSPPKTFEQKRIYDDPDDVLEGQVADLVVVDVRRPGKARIRVVIRTGVVSSTPDPAAFGFTLEDLRKRS